MPKVIVTAEVEDVTHWEQNFRTHGALFRSQTVTTPVGIAVQADNTVACCFEPTDLNTFMEVLESPETAKAMGADGVKRDTVKLYVMDREFQP
ncbi:MAG: hypothetical protein Ct9H300mP25_17510 [Acidobacteriota bacterium]|nr:MAG: hypothetical protein Ct9H300mP25_17510 [Acidobacteriota bacterium]